MKRMTLAVALSIIAGTHLGAQERSNAPSAGNATTTEQPGRAVERMNDTAAQGSQVNKPDTLMDKRAKAMSPQGASTPGKTGRVSQ
ncbi:hypothetical protein [Paraburkholderia hospita]|uniref:hypothetical protein n=1 Tax=Paraburkholderia TaxID=1822464 RepID=UPI0010546D47|nr:hypothetical protein [Paraburkholderia hospita]